MFALDTTIRAVTVLTDRARVTRTGTIRLPAGSSVIVINNLPTQLIAESVRVKGRGAGARIAGSQVETTFIAAPASEDAAALQAALDALRDRDSGLVDAVAAVDARLEMSKALRAAGAEKFAKAIATGKASLDTLRPMSQYLDSETLDALASRRALNVQRRELAREIKAAEARLAQAGSGARTEARAIHIDVDASSEVDAEFDITYQVYGASWVPVYDARLSGNALTLTYYAQVSQTTGENWPPCPLSLSTAEGGSGGTIPELDPWYVAKYEPPPPRQKMAIRGGMVQEANVDYAAGPMMQSMAMPAAAPAPRMADASAEVVSSGVAVTYRVARPVALPSDGAQRKTLIGEATLEATLDYLSVPKLGQEAYLRAKTRNRSEFVLLPGDASLFHDDELVGTTTFEEPLTPQAEFELQLGVDSRIRIERELTQRDTGKTLIGNTRRMTFGYKIKVTNTRGEPARVSVQDQIPVSRHEEIKIKLGDSAPRPTEQTDLGILTWTLDLPASATREITYTYTVEHPRDMTVIGLE